MGLPHGYFLVPKNQIIALKERRDGNEKMLQLYLSHGNYKNLDSPIQGFCLTPLRLSEYEDKESKIVQEESIFTLRLHFDAPVKR